MEDDGEENNQPIDFDTFVPTHDPGLEKFPDSQPSLYASQLPGPNVSRDDAFERATRAWYWAGYWTAIYHVSLKLSDMALDI